MDNLEVLQQVKQIALQAGAILRSFWGKTNDIHQKQDYWDLVTEADLASESFILDRMKAAFPEHRILSEEAGLSEKADARYLWCIDPLDGTTNFTHQYPMVSVSIGLLIDNVPALGVIYNPILEELFLAANGVGATLNGNKIHVSKVNTLEKSLLATGFAYDRKRTKDNNYPEFCHMTQSSQGVRRGGSAAIDLAYVATGRLDGYWERGLQPWDIAAGVAIVREAGGEVTSYENGPIDLHSGRILATNGLIHGLLSRELQTIAHHRTLP